ncbi:hypothetical protein FLONG3_4249 [Fusarium longipes]|uniref:Uncharacterized protein n=1 Tax=Fusarium longipes TaxID=694270 RepID=A0A395SZN2_9HYPO|nr:hypothetical protein FLONG3_4249 [Fusarium longipes]
MTSAKPSRYRRLQMLGTASLPALLIGGLVLILVGVNALSNYSPTPSDRSTTRFEFGKSRVPGQVAFKIGREWSVQTWIAITGVAFGLLSFGFAETYIHVFDTWCSRQAQRENGLDYARYLNSQARAPVLYGFRGFPAFVTLRYTIIAMGVAVSVGYKFAFATPEIWVRENIDQEAVRYKPHRMSMVQNQSSFSDTEPWITDFPLYDVSRSFSHHYQYGHPVNGELEHSSDANTTLPPNMLVMVGHASCLPVETHDPPFNQGERGTVYTREIGLVANGSVAEGTFTMTEDRGEWQRIEAPNSRIFNPPQKAIVEYRISEFAELQIQWAKAPDDSSNTWKVPVVHRSRYKMNVGVFQVARYVSSQNCVNIAGYGGSGVYPRALNNDTLENWLVKENFVHRKEELGRDYLNITRKMPEFSVWLEPLIKTQDTTLLASVSAIIRAVMTAYKMDMWDTTYMEDDDMPLGEEVDLFSERYPGAKNPFYVGSRVGKYSGCYVTAAIVFVVLGCFAILVGVFRVWLGPPVLTSWMGQHVCLARTETISLSEKASGLASGYKVAERGLGRLRLSTQKGGEAGTMLRHDNSSDSDGRSNNGREGEQGEVHGVTTRE